jgi:hypothetical protein
MGLRGAIDGVPFRPGDQPNLRHGAYVSDVRLDDDPRVQAYVDWIEATQPVSLSHPAGAGTIWLLARVYVRIERSGKALDQVDAEIGDMPAGGYGKGREWRASLRDDHERWIARASKLEEQLGRTPASRAKLLLHVGQGAQIREDLLRRYSGDQDAA